MKKEKMEMQDGVMVPAALCYCWSDMWAEEQKY
jgi:hypothetical protein